MIASLAFWLEALAVCALVVFMFEGLPPLIRRARKRLR